MKQEGIPTLPNPQGLFCVFKSVRLLSCLISLISVCICFLSLGALNKTLATNYYVDSSITDTNPASATPDCTNYNTSTFACSGGSSSAYKTIADINAGSFSGDDQILFRKGQTWREQLTVPSSGTSGHPITFGAFGSGAKPIINGANTVSGSWTAATSGITNVQSTHHIISAGDSASRTYAQTPTQGNLLIATSLSTVVIGSCSMSGSGWSLATSALKGSTASIGLWYKVAGASEPTTVTVTCTGSTSTGITISEWTGNDPTPLDKVAYTDNSGSVISKSTGTTATTTVANELLYAVIGMGECGISHQLDEFICSGL